MRFAVDWESINKYTTPQLRRKKIARFTQHVVKAKAAEIMCMYIKSKSEAGLCKMELVDLSSGWFSHWRHEYGLSLRRPNRRYKVPKAVLAERLEIGWLNVFRARAAILALKGYDHHVGPIAFSSQ